MEASVKNRLGKCLSARCNLQGHSQCTLYTAHWTLHCWRQLRCRYAMLRYAPRCPDSLWLLEGERIDYYYYYYCYRKIITISANLNRPAFGGQIAIKIEIGSAELIWIARLWTPNEPKSFSSQVSTSNSVAQCSLVEIEANWTRPPICTQSKRTEREREWADWSHLHEHSARKLTKCKQRLTSY